MTDVNDPDRIRADIERTRAELSGNVDALTDTANPANIAGRQVDKVKDAARSVRDRIMGSPDDQTDQGRVGEVAAQARQTAASLGDAVSDAPARAKQGTRGNPLVAGLVAFGVGFLIASLIPSSRQEEQAVTRLQENLEPLGQQAKETAQEMADNLRGSAQEAAETVKSVAGDAAERVQHTTEDARDNVRAQAEDSADTVRRNN